MAEDQTAPAAHKIVTGPHKRKLPPAGTVEHPLGTVIEVADGRRYQADYSGELYAWYEVEPDQEAAKQSAAASAADVARLEAELAAARERS